MKARTWTVPAERMKAGEEHKVPIADRVVSILEALPRRGQLVFAGVGGKPLSETALLDQLRGRQPVMTTHGFLRAAERARDDDDAGHLAAPVERPLG